MRGLLLFFVLLAGCTGEVDKAVDTPKVVTGRPGSPAAPPAPVRTDRTSYVLAPGRHGGEVTIAATLRAPDDQTLHILNCNGISGLTLQRKVEDKWENAWLVSMPACFSPPIVVPPGGEQRGSLHLVENSANAISPNGTTGLVSGIYRIVWTGVFTAWEPNKPPGAELPLEQRVSAPISIEVPR
jgi:hypothetical protein